MEGLNGTVPTLTQFILKQKFEKKAWKYSEIFKRTGFLPMNCQLQTKSEGLIFQASYFGRNIYTINKDYSHDEKES